MALHDLVKLRQSLIHALDASGAVSKLLDLRNRIDNVKFQVPIIDAKYLEYIDSLVAYYESIITDVEQPVQEFQAKLNEINNEINILTHKLFFNNYELETFYGTVESVRNNRRIYVAEDIEQDIKQRILLHTSWRYPALEIGCRDGEWTQFLVAADPLYVMDRHTEFLTSTNSRFPAAYQARLRKYLLKNHDLSALPKGQMAFVFSWGYFNYVSMDTMKQYLRQIYNILRPGGIFMFSYNDGDTPQGAGMAENMAQSYMPKSMLIPLCESIGYKINEESNYGNQISWLELRRPGELHTIKAHQVLGEIKRQEN